MKSSIISYPSSSKTLAIPTAASSFNANTARHQSEGRGDSSRYFLGCRKGTNCNCKICLASFNAILDLIPTGSSIKKPSSLPKRSASPPLQQVMELATPPATPGQLISTQSLSFTPPVESTARSRLQIRGIPGVKGGFCVLGHWKLMVFVSMFLFTAVNLGFLKGVMEVFGPRLTKEMLEQFVEESGCKAVDLRARLRILELKIAGVVDRGVLNCSSLNTPWEIKQWSDGKLDATSGIGNGTSWTLKRWMTVVMQLESNTWVHLEYKRRALFEDPRLLPAALKALRLRSIRIFEVVKQKTGRLLSLGSCISYAHYHPEEGDLMHHPT